MNEVQTPPAPLPKIRKFEKADALDVILGVMLIRFSAVIIVILIASLLIR
jgi:hypothetical protein